MPDVARRPVFVLLVAAVLIAGACGAADTSASPTSAPTRPTASIEAFEPSATASRAPTLTPLPADPFVGQVVVTVSDGLRVRSQPRVSDDSIKYEPLLPLGTELTVIDGPVSASGYVWYRVTPVSVTLRDGPGNGWVAVADKDGEAWISLAGLAAGWPVTGVSGTVIGPDGTAYAWMGDGDSEILVAALDSSGTMRPGWPFRINRRAYTPSLDVGADGSLLVGTHDEDGPGFRLDRVGADGQEVTGWPYRDDGASYCSPPVAGAHGAIILACSQRGGQTSTIVVIDEAGRVVPGWPVTFDGVERLDSVQSGPAGTVYALGTPNDPGELARLWAYAADGSLRPGFPVTLESRVARYQLARDRILVSSYIPPDPPPDGLCGGAERTVLAEFDAVGRIVPGWPVSAQGWASIPDIGPDGTVYYVERDRLFARGPDGSLRPGWPVEIPPVYPECGAGGQFLGENGTVYVVDDVGRMAAFGPDGQARPGWPVTPAHGFAAWFCSTDAPGGTSPVLGPDGRVYAAVVGTSDANGAPVTLQIVALDSTGRLVPGWPYTLPGTGRGEVVLLGVVDGRLYVSLSRCGPSDSSTALLALDPDGSISD